MAAAIIPWPPWCPPPNAKAYVNQPRLGAALEIFPLENPKKLFSVPRTQPKLGKRAAPKVAFPYSLPRPFHPTSSNAIFIEIDPRGKEFAMNIP
jgi:hypothetical protein